MIRTTLEVVYVVLSLCVVYTQQRRLDVELTIMETTIHQLRDQLDVGQEYLDTCGQRIGS